MALVVVGGHSRNVGKTSVVAGLIAALPEFKWTAMKITQYGHNVCSQGWASLVIARLKTTAGPFPRKKIVQDSRIHRAF